MRLAGLKRFVVAGTSVISGGLVTCKCEENAEHKGWGHWFRSWIVDEDTLHFKSYQQGLEGPGMMLWPSLERGLRRRAEDEEKVRKIVKESRQYVVDCMSKGHGLDEQVMTDFTKQTADILYGHGVTTQERQTYIEKYGCAAYTDRALLLIAKEVSGRPGIVEMGAGNGQWARQLESPYGVNVMAFDSMESLPLRGPTYHPNSEVYRQYFYSNVRAGDESVFLRSDLKRALTGRALLLVFPDPGDMAVRCIRNYTASHEKNDMVIYVGEGRGGANADSALFDWLESGEWILHHSMPLSPLAGSGYERLFIFTRKAEKMTVI